MSDRLPNWLRSVLIQAANLLVLLILVAAAASIPIGAALGLL